MKKVESKFIPKQFEWEQTDNEVIIMINEKYFEFCWHASCSAGEFPELTKSSMQVNITKSSLEILLRSFQVQAFIGTFSDQILLDECYWDYIPQKGIKFMLSKRIEGKNWTQPFSQYEKEMYYKNFKILRQFEKQGMEQELYELASRLPPDQKNSYLKSASQEQEMLEVQFEQSFQALRNNGYTVEFYQKWWRMQEKEYNYANDMSKVSMFKLPMLSQDVILKKQEFSQQSFLNMKPVLISDLEYGVNLKKFIVVQALTNSIIMKSNYFLIQDPYLTTTRLFIYGLQNYAIKKGTFLLIKEPFFKFGARDHIPLIRIDNMNDLVLFPNETVFNKRSNILNDSITHGQLEKLTQMTNQQFECLVFSIDMKQLTFTVMTYYSKEQSFEKGQPVLYIQQEKNVWIPGNITKISQVSPNFFEVQLSDTLQSQLMMECLKNKTEKEPGNIATLWKEQTVQLQDLFEYILLNNDIPLKFLNPFIEKASKQSKNYKYQVSEVFQLFNSERDNVVNKKQLKKSKLTNNQKEENVIIESIKQKSIINSINEVLTCYDAHQKNKMEKKTFLQESDFKQPFVQYIPEHQLDKKTIIEERATNETQLINTRGILENLTSETDKLLVESALFYLKDYISRISENIEFVDSKMYGNYVIKNKICEKEFSLESVLKSLNLVQFSYDSQIVEKHLRQKEKRKMKRKNKKKSNQKDDIIEQLGQLENDFQLIDKEEDIKTMTEEFNNGQNSEEDCDSNYQDDIDMNDIIQISDGENISLNQRINTDQLKSNLATEKVEKKIEMEDDKSVQSLLTVHSKIKTQGQNEHWKQRLEERHNIDATKKEIKEEILQNLKSILKYEGTEVIVSKKNKNRVLVKDKKNNIQYILMKTNQVENEKTIYIPITVLSSHMKFK